MSVQEISVDVQPVAAELGAASREEAVARAGGVSSRLAAARRRAILRTLVLADVAALMIAGTGAAALTGLIGTPSGLLVFAWVPVFVVVTAMFGLYRRELVRLNHSTVDELGTILQATTLATWLVYAALSVAGGPTVGMTTAVVLWGLSLVVCPVSRAIARFGLRRSPLYPQRTLIVGAGEIGQSLARKLVHREEYGLRIVGFIDSDPRERRRGAEVVPVVGGIADLPEVLDQRHIDRVVFAFSSERHEAVLDTIRVLQRRGVQIDVVPRLFEVLPGGGETVHVEGIPLVPLPRMTLSRSARALKRALDLAVAVPALIVLAPAFAVIAAAVRLDSRGGVFFRQPRVGAGGEVFTILKFRTMVDDADRRKAEFAHLNKHILEHDDSRMFKIPDDPRVTRVGGFLRRYSIDELPQLVNVVTGEMTLVGPRPLILEEDRFVPDWARQRLALKPGITGLWQVLGNSFIPFEEMVKLDYLYVSSWTLWSDIALMLKTLRVLGGKREFA